MPSIHHRDGSVREGETLAPAVMPPLGIDGQELTFIRINFQTRLQFGDTEIVIETPFTLTVGGRELLLAPADHAGLGPVLGIYPGTLASAVIDDDLTLRLSFEGGAGIAVSQDSRYEAWHVLGPGSRWIVCPPVGTGTLSVWH